jgi:hypothetical protein
VQLTVPTALCRLLVHIASCVLQRAMGTAGMLPGLQQARFVAIVVKDSPWSNGTLPLRPSNRLIYKAGFLLDSFPVSSYIMCQANLPVSNYDSGIFC